ERPFKCPFEGCGRSFTTSNIRKVHIRTHTGERPYYCSEPGCGRAFASATNYKNHVRIHTGEKPYVCTVPGCDKRFTEYSSLYKHHVVHTHSKPYNCNHCGKTYKQISTLAMHKKTAHNDTEPIEEEPESFFIPQPRKCPPIVAMSPCWVLCIEPGLHHRRLGRSWLLVIGAQGVHTYICTKAGCFLLHVASLSIITPQCTLYRLHTGNTAPPCRR
ncbi:hypothetical protein AB205_0066130, partial [Aquarana catesbeiana]